MSGNYKIKITDHFSSAHVIHGYDGPCNRLHGHNWTVMVEVETSQLDEIGMGMDFRELKALSAELANYLDHQNLNELPPFKNSNPTAETIARWYFNELADKTDNGNVHLCSVTIWETDNCSVTYTPCRE